MKKNLRRAVSGLLAAAVFATVCLASTYGDRKDSSEKEVSPGTELCRGTWLSSGTPQSENYIEYTPNLDVSPVTAYGSKLFGTSTYRTTASWLESKGLDVIAAVNGDFFNTSTGLPNGIAVTEGVLRGSDGYQNAVGFRSDGSAIIGKPSTTVRLGLPSGEAGVYAVNRMLSDAGIFLYSSDYSANTRSSSKAVYVTLDPAGAKLRLSGSLTAAVTDCVTSSSAVDIPEGKLILAAVDGTTYYKTLSALKTGDSVWISISCAGGWEDVQYAVGANQLLLQNGSIISGLDSSAAPRTAVGVKADGGVILYTVDGRQSGLSRGVGLGDLAARLRELGCVSAANLDGGGSTVMAVRYPGRDGLETVNSPSDGSLRKCANFIFLVNNMPASGNTASVHIYPYDARMMTGSSLAFSAGAADAGWHAARPGPVSWSCSGGSISPDGVWTAPAEPGSYTVSASASGVTGGTEVQVFSPDEIVILKGGSDVTSRQLTVSRGSQLSFSVKAYNAHRELICDNTLFDWTLSGSVGTALPDGSFTAADTADGATGVLTVSRDGVSSRVDLRIPGEVRLYEDFEGDLIPVSEFNASLSVTEDKPDVMYGLRAAAVSYSAAPGAAAQLDFPCEISEGRPYLCMWVKGDGSDAVLCALFDNGETERICSLSAAEWRFVSVKAPRDCGGLAAFVIESDAGSSGVFFMDSLHANSEGGEDSDPPSVYVDYDGSAVVRDSGELKREYVSVTLDTRAVDFDFDPDSGSISPQIGETGPGLHVLTVVCRDAVGNLAADMTTLGGSLGNPFPDAKGHWAANNIEYLYTRGVVAGSLDSGTLRYRPDRAITRAEFAVILSRWLGADTEACDSYELPFEDADSIPSWAVPHVKAMVSAGVIAGSLSEGRLVFAPHDDITRAQAMTMLGRTQPMGWGGSLSGYSDGGQVPSWAARYVAQLTGRGAVSGSGGAVRPSGSVTRAEVAKMITALS